MAWTALKIRKGRTTQVAASAYVKKTCQKRDSLSGRTIGLIFTRKKI